MKLSRDPSTLLLVRFNQATTNARKRFLGELSIGDVQARSNESGKRAVVVKSRHTNVQ